MNSLKKLTYVFLITTILASCGKNDDQEDNSSVSNSPHLSSLSNVGIEITSEFQEGSSFNKNNFNSYYSPDSGYISIKCLNRDDETINNYKRADYLQQLLTTVRADGYLRIDGRDYDGTAVEQMIQQSISIVAYTNGYSGNSNYSNSCPRDLLSQNQVRVYDE